MGCCSSVEPKITTNKEVLATYVKRKEAAVQALNKAVEASSKAELPKLFADAKDRTSAEHLFGLKAFLNEKVKFATALDKDDKIYTELAHRSWNRDAISFPAVIVQIQDLEKDTVACINFAAQVLKLKICCVSGYHSTSAIADGSFVIDFDAKRGTQMVDAAEEKQEEKKEEKKEAKEEEGKAEPVKEKKDKLLVVEAGCRLQEAGDILKKEGRVLPFGTNYDTGIAGLTMAGGIGFLVNRFGYTCDNVIWCDLVIYDKPEEGARVIRATHDNEHKDVLWQLLGSGQCAGAILRFCYKTFEFEPSCATTTVVDITGNQDKKKAYIKRILAVAKECPVENSFINIVLPIGAPVVVCVNVVNDVKNSKKAQEAVDKFVALGSETCCCRPTESKKENYFEDTMRMLESKQVEGYYYQSFLMFKDLDGDETWNTLVKYTSEVKMGPGVTDSSLAFFMSPDGSKGKMNDQNNSKTSFPFRSESQGMALCLFKLDQSLLPQGKKSAREWLHALRAELMKKDLVIETTHQFEGNLEKVKVGADSTAAAVTGGEGEGEKKETVGDIVSSSAPTNLREKLKNVLNTYDPSSAFHKNRGYSY